VDLVGATVRDVELAKPISLNVSPSMTNTPSAIMSATKNTLPSGLMRTSCGMPPFDSFR